MLGDLLWDLWYLRGDWGDFAPSLRHSCFRLALDGEVSAAARRRGLMGSLGSLFRSFKFPAFFETGTRGGDNWDLGDFGDFGDFGDIWVLFGVLWDW